MAYCTLHLQLSGQHADACAHVEAHKGRLAWHLTTCSAKPSAGFRIRSELVTRSRFVPWRAVVRRSFLAQEQTPVTTYPCKRRRESAAQHGRAGTRESACEEPATLLRLFPRVSRPGLGRVGPDDGLRQRSPAVLMCRYYRRR